MTSWNRRLNAASQRERVTSGRSGDVLAQAVELGVSVDDQAALAALAKLAADRPGYRTTLVVRAGEPPSDLLFEVVGAEQGVRVQPADGAAAPPSASPGATTAPGEEREAAQGPDIVQVLSDTMVETPDLVAVFASVGHEALWANDAFVTVVPIREADKIWLVELLDEWSKGHYEVKVLPALVKYGRWRGRLTVLTGDGDPLPVSAVIVAHRDHEGEIEAVSFVARQVADMQAAETAGADQVRFAALVEHSSDIIAVLDPDGQVQYSSPATDRILGLEEGALQGSAFLDIVHPDDRPDDLIGLARPDEQGIGAPVELRLQAADGTWRYLEVVVSDLTANPAIGGLVLNARDVTERVEATRALAGKAFTDQLTGLPNRMRLIDRLGTALGDEPPGRVAVLLVDLDHYRGINEAYGQAVADQVLRTVATRLDEAAEEATVARLRGDEFAVVLRGVPDAADALRLANRLLTAVRQPVTVDASRVEVTCSIGLAISKQTSEAEVLLHEADQALSHAKASGGNRCEAYGDELAELATRRRSIEQQLRRVIDDESLVVHYQPIVDIETERVVGAEALLRVLDGDGTLLSPAEFIDAAESTGLITRLGSQMLQVTAAQLGAWSTQGGGAQEVSVNISPRQLADRDLPQHVLGALQSAGVPPERVCLEITENTLIGHQATVDASISYLRALGVKIGLDEFGAGQSSLGYLKRFPLDFVKIDRSLVAGLGIDEQDTAIVRATVELAHNLGLVVIAVGVETDEQLEMLQLLQCDRAQGYLFAPALSAEEFAAPSG